MMIDMSVARTLAERTAAAYLSLAAAETLRQAAKHEPPERRRTCHYWAAAAEQYAVDYWARPLIDLARAYGPASVLGELRHAWTVEIAPCPRPYSRPPSMADCDDCPWRPVCRTLAPIYRQMSHAEYLSTDGREAIYRAYWAGTLTGPMVDPITIYTIAADLFECYDWGGNYGGTAWQYIAEVLLDLEQRDWTGDPVIIADTLVNLQHNTSVWLNKLPIRPGTLMSVIHAKAHARDYADLLRRLLSHTGDIYLWPRVESIARPVDPAIRLAWSYAGPDDLHVWPNPDPYHYRLSRRRIRECITSTVTLSTPSSSTKQCHAAPGSYASYWAAVELTATAVPGR